MEVSSSMRKQNQWLAKRPNLEVGDICVRLRKDKRNQYPLCRVVEILSKGDKVHVVMVKRGNKIFPEVMAQHHLYLILPHSKVDI